MICEGGQKHHRLNEVGVRPELRPGGWGASKLRLVECQLCRELENVDERWDPGGMRA